MKTLRSALEAWCKGTEEALVQSYDKHGRRASGAWADSLETRISDKSAPVGPINIPGIPPIPVEGLNVTGYKIEFLAAHYPYWMERGRKGSAKFPPIDKIRQWVEDKGLISSAATDSQKNSLAFLIARKIKERGFMGKPVIADVMTQQRIDELSAELGPLIKEQLSSAIIQQLNLL